MQDMCSPAVPFVCPWACLASAMPKPSMADSQV
ncbi:hypothetical protein A2U01_0102958 [Trifolium medium]|uniref:Uncharacterized protein n=1 Tax=Trifolium medium TaxID=97028 RepID=A0A392V054_9FABA|nr:hypothetical protein [Trifolium medium]